jgi:hypothetical protein
MKEKSHLKLVTSILPGQLAEFHSVIENAKKEMYSRVQKAF